MTLFVEFWNHIIVVELLEGLGSQFRGGVTLISSLVPLEARQGADNNQNVVTKIEEVRILFNIHLLSIYFY
jgi:hypothetical protein